ncbi:MAG: hypothetical protein ACYS8W_03085 [Planctomycetota bacterium]|jgi:hypothetical protein
MRRLLFFIFVSSALLVLPACTGGSNYDYESYDDEGYDDEPVASSSSTPSGDQPRETSGETVDTGQGFKIAGGPTVGGISRGGSFGSQKNFNHYRDAGRAAAAAEKLFSRYVRDRASTGNADKSLIDQALTKIDFAITEFGKISGATGQMKAEIEECISDAYNMRSSIVRETD